MDIILHAGAHRTGTTSFQTYLRAHRARLEGQAIGFWGPWRTRKGLLNSVVQRPESRAQAERAAGRVQINLQGARKRDVGMLIVSDENIIGTPRGNLRAGALYPEIGERMARLNAAFDGQIRRIVLNIRSPEIWWASAMAYLVARGEPLPRRATLQQLAGSRRGWRQVITDLACACPETEIRVAPFERIGGHPDRLFRVMTGLPFAPQADPAEFWINRSPDLVTLSRLLTEQGQNADRLPQGEGRWMPFDDYQAATLREAYADDLFWLQAGADGLARLTEEDMPARPGQIRAAGFDERGRKDDKDARGLARARRERAARTPA
ncbi:MAG: hypothetical protein QNJ09_16200 [Paracoccaceae bacterium]|nr:hypothetical protein [Paracoccaceae bacterium]